MGATQASGAEYFLLPLLFIPQPPFTAVFMQGVFRAKAHSIDGVVHPPVATMAIVIYVVLLGVVMVVAQLWRWLAVIILGGCSGVHFLHE